MANLICMTTTRTETTLGWSLCYADDTGAAVPRIGSSHVDLSHQYGCRASMTSVTFVFCGVVHRARRFFRADMAAETGTIEIYTIEPYPGAQWTLSTELGWYSSATAEDFVGYAAANPAARRDRLATMLVNAAIGGDALGEEQDARFAAMELT